MSGAEENRITISKEMIEVNWSEDEAIQELLSKAKENGWDTVTDIRVDIKFIGTSNDTRLNKVRVIASGTCVTLNQLTPCLN